MALSACRPAAQSFWSITSVDLTTAFTTSPFLSPSSSALRRVMTLSITFLPTRTLTWTRTSPYWISMIFPLSWFLADSGICRHYTRSDSFQVRKSRYRPKFCDVLPGWLLHHEDLRGSHRACRSEIARLSGATALAVSRVELECPTFPDAHFADSFGLSATGRHGVTPAPHLQSATPATGSEPSRQRQAAHSPGVLYAWICAPQTRRTTSVVPPASAPSRAHSPSAIPPPIKRRPPSPFQQSLPKRAS